MLRLQFERIARGLTQAQLARLAGTHQSHVSLIEQGRLRPTKTELEGLACALGCAQPAALLRRIVAVDATASDVVEATR